MVTKLIEKWELEVRWFVFHWSMTWLHFLNFCFLAIRGYKLNVYYSYVREGACRDEGTVVDGPIVILQNFKSWELRMVCVSPFDDLPGIFNFFDLLAIHYFKHNVFFRLNFGGSLFDGGAC